MARSFGLLSVDNNVATTAYDREVLHVEHPDVNASCLAYFSYASCSH
jgi:hypothetical protein